MIKVIDRNDISIQGNEEYKNIIDNESHHNHNIVLIDGVLRWEECKITREFFNKNSLNIMIDMFNENNISKNSEFYRKLYRDLGYSLNGYWEVFYWDMNNEESEKYKSNSEA